MVPVAGRRERERCTDDLDRERRRRGSGAVHGDKRDAVRERGSDGDEPDGQRREPWGERLPGQGHPGEREEREQRVRDAGRPVRVRRIREALRGGP